MGLSLYTEILRHALLTSLRHRFHPLQSPSSASVCLIPNISIAFYSSERHWSKSYRLVSQAISLFRSSPAISYMPYLNPSPEYIRSSMRYKNTCSLQTLKTLIKGYFSMLPWNIFRFLWYSVHKNTPLWYSCRSFHPARSSWSTSFIGFMRFYGICAGGLASLWGNWSFRCCRIVCRRRLRCRCRFSCRFRYDDIARDNEWSYVIEKGGLLWLFAG